MRKISILLVACCSFLCVNAQKNFWTETSENAVGKNVFERKQRPSEFKLFRLQLQEISRNLLNAPSDKNVSSKNSMFSLLMPGPDGSIQEFKIVDAPVMHPDLAARYPNLRQYAGRSVKDPTITIRFSVSPRGLDAVVFSPGKPSYYIKPLDESGSIYSVVSREHLAPVPKFRCDNEEQQSQELAKSVTGTSMFNADDAQLRTYRLAMAASGEYSARWLTGSEPDDATRRANVLAAMVVNVTNVNAILERDFGVRLILIANTDDVIYLNAGTDPWTDNNSDALCDQTEIVMNDEIGEANYDIGHLVHEAGDYGKAGCIGCVCSADNTKGRGFTSRSNWNSGNGFEEYILAHEMGHQFDANHTFTHADDNDAAQIEPGSGTTLMSYAGITGANTDIQSIMDDYFHAISIQQVTNYIKSQACNGGGASNNNVPTANAGADYTVPKSTPFTLTGTATDADEENNLTYVWEQMNNLTAASDFPWIPSSTQTYGPEFRSYPPSTSRSRTFPILSSILDGTNGHKWERLPSVDRSLNFRFTVRDNNPGAGANESDDMVVTVDGDLGPFTVTSPNTNVAWCPGTHTVTWDVNGTDELATQVRILLSTDGGLTFPTVLVAATDNDGSANVTIGCTPSSTARIKIEAIGNIFFDISNTNFSIGDGQQPTFTAPPNITIYKDANCNHNSSTSITGDVTDEADNCDNTLNATFSDGIANGSCVGEQVITRTWTLTDDCGNTTQKVQTITIRDTTRPTFTQPADITIYKDANCNHDASVGVTGDVTDEDDNCDNTLDATFSDVTVPGSCIGEEIITRTWTLTDDCGNSSSKNQVITVRDTTRPSITNVSANPTVLWPPNHQMRPVTINYVAVDNCSPVTNSLSVTSNEEVNGTGDGNTAPDWEVLDDHNILLRAERKGNGNGRIYTITITSVDDCGNTATATVTVSVPHNQTMARPFEAGTSPAMVPGKLVVKALPNPTVTDFTISVDTDFSKERTVMTVYDLYGRTIETRNVNSNIVKLGSEYLPGVYIVRIQQGSESRELKLVKTRR